MRPKRDPAFDRWVSDQSIYPVELGNQKFYTLEQTQEMTGLPGKLLKRWASQGHASDGRPLRAMSLMRYWPRGEDDVSLSFAARPTTCLDEESVLSLRDRFLDLKTNEPMIAARDLTGRIVRNWDEERESDRYRGVRTFYELTYAARTIGISTRTLESWIAYGSALIKLPGEERGLAFDGTYTRFQNSRTEDNLVIGRDEPHRIRDRQKLRRWIESGEALRPIPVTGYRDVLLGRRGVPDGEVATLKSCLKDRNWMNPPKRHESSEQIATEVLSH